MPRIEISPVTTGSQRKAVLRLPWVLHGDDPNWVPPLRANHKALLGFKKHPFYEDAQGQTFLATRDGRPCGSVLAVVNHAHNRAQKEKIGFFGFFESTDDEEVAHGLLKAAADWLGERGMTAMRGPCNPSLNYECGLLVDGFDSPPTFMMTYNPEYYIRLIESFGLVKSQDLFAYDGHIDMLDSLDEKLEYIAREVTTRFDIKFRGMDKSSFVEEVEMFLDIYNRSMAGTWGFAPLSDAELKHLGKELRWLIVPELVSIAEVEGKVIGVCFGLLDFNPIVKRIDGRLFPLGFLKLLFGRRSLDRIRVVSTNVLPEYQRWGVGLVLLANLLPAILEWGIQTGEFSWVLESNDLSRQSLEKGGARLQKTFRLYDYALAEE